MVFISHFICNSITLNTSSYENRVVDGEEARRAPGAHLHRKWSPNTDDAGAAVGMVMREPLIKKKKKPSEH